MSERVERLPSKIVQYDDHNNVALCENGSVWEYFHMSKLWAQIHPPHEPPKVETPHTMDCLRILNEQSAELQEALDALESIMTNPDNDFQPTFGLEILRKHGRCK